MEVCSLLLRSVIDSSLQWTHCSSDGVQVGNVGSAMGVVGVWTTALHDQGLFADSHTSTFLPDHLHSFLGDPVGTIIFPPLNSLNLG